MDSCQENSWFRLHTLKQILEEIFLPQQLKVHVFVEAVKSLNYFYSGSTKLVPIVEKGNQSNWNNQQESVYTHMSHPIPSLLMYCMPRKKNQQDIVYTVQYFVV